MLGFILYWKALSFEFLINFDDDKLITQSTANLHLNAESIHTLFTESVFGLYHPITSLSWAIEHQLYGFNSKWFHFSNILWHLLNTILVYFLSKHYLKRNDWSLLVSLLFVLHPMHTENIVWLSARKDLVYGCFFLLALLSYIAFLKKRKILFYVFMCLCFIASLFSKSNAVVFPAILILVDLYENQSFKWKFILNKLPLFALSALFVYITLKTQEEAGFINSFEGEYSILDRFFMGVYSLSYYLFRFLFPFDLSPKNLYPSKINGSLPWLYYAAPFFLAFMSYMIYKIGKKEKLVWFGAAFFLIIILPVLKIIPTGNDIVSNRYTYLPYLGLYMGFILYVFKCSSKPLYYFLPVWFIAMFFYAYSYQENYKNSYQLWSKIIEENDDNKWGQAMAYNERGYVLFLEGQNEASRKDIEKALKLAPNLSRGLMNMSVILDKNGQHQEALKLLDKVLLNDKNNFHALKLRGVSFAKLNQLEQAVEDFNMAISIRPQNAELLNNRGIAYSILGKNQKALLDFNKAIDLQPLNTQFSVNRGNLYVQMGKTKKALEDYLRAYKQDSRSIAIAYPLAKTYFQTKEGKKAKEILRPFTAKQQVASEIANRLVADSLAKESLPYYTIAIEEESIRDKSLYQRAQAYKQLGETQNAIDDLIAILENVPNPQIFLEIGNLYWQREEKTEACDYWNEGAIRNHTACKALLEKHCS